MFGWWMSILHMTKTNNRIMYIPIAQVVVDSSHLLLVVQAANLFTDPPQICEGKVRQLEYFVDSRHFMCNINKKY